MTDSDPHPPSTRTRSIYRLGDLLIDVGTAQVRRQDQLIPLPRLSFDLLLALVKAAPNLVTVDELMDQVWPGVVVNSETVSQRVKLLRVALEDDPRQPRYIAVSRGRGYRIVGEVETLDRPATTSIAPSPTTVAPPVTPTTLVAPPLAASTKLPRWTWPALLALVVVGLVATLLLRSAAPPPIAATALPDRSVAVLPFDNLGQSPDDAALAFGVAETLLHRLSASKELTVIARQSSFSFAPRGADVRDIGRKLNAHYLIEGSLQSTPDRLRITAQLIDATTGGHVWSLQFDRKPQDIFIIQDEIAAKVTEALRISLAGSTPVDGRGTKDFDAWLAHAQGRARLATKRVADGKLAIADFERAIRIDPKFARAYAGLAEASLFVASTEMSRDRAQTLEREWQKNRLLLEQAVKIDELDADIHLQLADFYSDDARADKELARALQLNPNSAPAYRVLANLRMFRDRLPDEAMIAIDKARLLSPLEVQYDNDKARLALWGKSDAHLAEQLSLSVLDRDPSSTDAMWMLGELYWCCRAQQARGINYLEQAMQKDPDNEFGRRILIRAYLELGDTKEAEAVAASAPHPVAARLVPVLAYTHDWAAAVARSYEEDRLGTSQAIERELRSLVVRIQARTAGGYEPARKHLTEWSYVTWSADGEPNVPSTWMADSSLGLADVLMQNGKQDSARRLLAAIEKSIDDERITRGRGDPWYFRARSVLYALLERDDDALTMLEECFAQEHMRGLALFLATDPAYERLRSKPRFRALVETVDRHIALQRAELDQMRIKKLVPWRTRG